MYDRRVWAIQVPVEELLRLVVGAKVDGTRREDPDQIGAQALEQGPRTLRLHDEPNPKPKVM